MDNLIKGVGVSLRQPHYQHFLTEKALVPWVEVMSDSFMFTHGLLREKVLKIRENYPMVMHGVGLNIGSVDPLDQTYLVALKRLANELQPSWVSDHLCWTGVKQRFSHDLLPLPYTEEALQHVVERITIVQDSINQPFLIENVSSYLQIESADYTEAEFLNEVAKRSGCYILLDINNIYVSATNHKFDAQTYLDTINKNFVKQFHLAGFETQNSLLVDTHGAPVADAVWQLYQQALRRFGAIATNIERDNNVPEWLDLKKEIKHATTLFQRYEAFDEAC